MGFNGRVSFYPTLEALPPNFQRDLEGKNKLVTVFHVVFRVFFKRLIYFMLRVCVLSVYILCTMYVPTDGCERLQIKEIK